MRDDRLVISQGACMGEDRNEITALVATTVIAAGRDDALSAALRRPVGSTAPARACCLNRRLRSPRLAGVLRDAATDVSATGAGRVKVVMAVHRWDDEEILRALRHAFRARQAVPRAFVEAGRNAFAWRNVGVELAQLTYDSARDLEPALSPRAETACARSLAFASPHLTIEIEVTPGSLLGQIRPAHGTVLTVQPRTGEESLVQASEAGCFCVEPIPPGPFRLHCRTAAGINVITGWITL